MSKGVVRLALAGAVLAGAASLVVLDPWSLADVAEAAAPEHRPPGAELPAVGWHASQSAGAGRPLVASTLPASGGAPVACQVRGCVVTDLGQPAAGVGVSLAGTAVRGTSLADGSFVLEHAPSGEHLVLVDPHTLPPGSLPPWRQAEAAAGAASRASHPGHPGCVAPGCDDAPLLIVLPTSASVTGRVLGPHGAGLAGASATLSGSGPGLTDLSARALTDAQGCYEMRGVYPGRYRFSVGLPPGPAAALGCPPPHTVEVPPAGDLRLNGVLGAGPCTVSGRIVDQDGQPFENVRVLAYHAPGAVLDERDAPWGWNDVAACVASGADGAFTLLGLERGALRLQYAFDFAPGQPPGSHLCTGFGPRQELDLRVAAAHVELPPVTLARSRPFRLHGQLVLDPTWAAAHGLAPRRLLVEVTPGVFGSAPDRVPVAADGTFAWSCETPHEPVTLTVRARRDPFPPRVQHISPQPEVTQVVTVHVP
jgi:hypothetical protein